MNYYTGIGSRNTPVEVIHRMTKLSLFLSEQDWVLRSGGAEGADRAFEDGVRKGKKAEIYTPWKNFVKYSENVIVGPTLSTWLEAQEIASNIHPAWERCSRGARALHTRNVYQVLGGDLQTPSRFVLFYAKESPSGNVSGGTRTAVEIARQHNIPCVNMYHDDWKPKLNNIWKGL